MDQKTVLIEPRNSRLADRQPEPRTRSIREVVNQQPILVFSGLAILWTTLFLAN